MQQQQHDHDGTVVKGNAHHQHSAAAISFKYANGLLLKQLYDLTAVQQHSKQKINKYGYAIELHRVLF